jgi:tripartite-type tricarboxylate transporter receptor subunit TctC
METNRMQQIIKTRRDVLSLAGATLLTTNSAVWAQSVTNFPNKPIKVIVPSAPGGVADILTRLIAPKMSEKLGQPVIVEYRAGAAGTIGLNAVARSAPDGYSLVFVSETHAAGETLYPKRGYNMQRELVPVTPIGNFPQVLAVNKNLPVTSLKELIEYAKANPNKLTYGSGGIGNTYHMGMELMSQMAGIKMLHIPYSAASSARTDLISGQIQLMFDTVGSMEPHIKAGTVRALGISSAQRFARLESVPTLAEAGVPGYLFESWCGLMGPAGMPSPVISKINEAVTFALQDKQIQTQFELNGVIPRAGTPQEFGGWIKTSIDKLAQVIKVGDIKVD